MIYQFDYYVKRRKTGGHYAVCFSSVTKAEPKQIIDFVNNYLELKDEPGITYEIEEVEIPSGKVNYFKFVSEKGN